MDLMNTLFARGPEPKAGNTLLYSLATGSLQAVRLTPTCHTMPVRNRDSEEIIGYAYHNRVPEFLYQCQWTEVPYEGGKVLPTIDTTEIKRKIQKQVVFINIRNNYDNAYRFGSAIAGAFGFGRVSTPEETTTGWYQLRMLIPLAIEDSTKFIDAFMDCYRTQLHLDVTATIEPINSTNWPFNVGV